MSLQNESVETMEVGLGLGNVEILEEGSNSLGRVRTPQRLRFEAEVEVIRKKIGELEEVRERLGLSRKQISDLLLVDPSSWTRWTSGDVEPPPHVYKTLSLLVAQVEKSPGVLTSNFESVSEAMRKHDAQIRDWVSHALAAAQDENAKNVKAKLEVLRSDYEARLLQEVAAVKSQILGREELSLGWKLFLVINFLGLIYLILFR